MVEIHLLSAKRHNSCLSLLCAATPSGWVPAGLPWGAGTQVDRSRIKINSRYLTHLPKDITKALEGLWSKPAIKAGRTKLAACPKDWNPDRPGCSPTTRRSMSRRFHGQSGLTDSRFVVPAGNWGVRGWVFRPRVTSFRQSR